MITRFGSFTLDQARRRLARSSDDGEIHLTPKAFDLLVFLAEEAPRVIRKAELHERLWPGTFVSDATLVGLVREVRCALQSDGGDGLIRTAHRVGYALDARVEHGVARASPLQHWIMAVDRQVTLRDGDNVIGRDVSADVRLEDVSVSRRHARLNVTGTMVVLEDLGSKNGTKVGGQPLTGAVSLRDGVRIEVGSVAIVYRTSTSAGSTITSLRGL